MVETFGHSTLWTYQSYFNKSTNRIRKYYKTLGTSVINSPMSPTSLPKKSANNRVRLLLWLKQSVLCKKYKEIWHVLDMILRFLPSRIRICSIVQINHNFSGIGSAASAIWISAGIGSLYFLACFIGIFCIERLGRRKLILFSLGKFCHFNS